MRHITEGWRCQEHNCSKQTSPCFWFLLIKKGASQCFTVHTSYVFNMKTYTQTKTGYVAIDCRYVRKKEKVWRLRLSFTKRKQLTSLTLRRLWILISVCDKWRFWMRSSYLAAVLLSTCQSVAESSGKMWSWSTWLGFYIVCGRISSPWLHHNRARHVLPELCRCVDTNEGAVRGWVWVDLAWWYQR